MAKYQGKYATKKEDAELEKSYRSLTPERKNTKKKKETAKSRKTVIGICISVIVLAITVLVGCVLFMNMDNGVIIENVYIAGVDVGGMTKSEAENAVRAATKKTLGKKDMVVTVLDSTIEIPAKAIKSFDVEKAVDAAYDFGNHGSKSKQDQEQQIAATTGYELDLVPYLKVDKNLIESKLDELGAIYNSTLKETSYEIVGEKPTSEQIQAGQNLQKLVIHLGRPEYGLDMDALYRSVMDAYSRNQFTVTGQCQAIEPEDIDLNAILEPYYVAPINASIKSGTKDVIPGVYGYGFDLEKAQQTIYSAEYGTTIEIEFERIEPAITKDNIYETMFSDKLSTWTAQQDSDANRQTNLRLACEAIDGVILYPGEVFSYNETLGERTEARGYKPGASYSGNQTVYTIGGGICQVSSALYHCVLHADLEVVYRRNHSFAQTYVPLGMDATVSWGTTDFLFRNNFDNPIRIEASADGGTTIVSIYGIDDKDYTIKVEYDILKETPSTDTKQQMSANNSQGYKDGDYIVTPYNGYEIKTYRCKYDKETGELISKEVEANSTYRVRNGIICEIKE